MNKLIKLTLVAAAVFLISGCDNKTENKAEEKKVEKKKEMKTTPSVANIDVKKECNIESNGIEKVLATASEYNAMAKKQGLEFMRLGMKTTQYIDGANAAVKSGAQTVDIVDKKKKKTGTVSTEYAAWRGCSFAIRALQQAQEAKTTWKLAIPGDGYTY